MGFTSFLKKLGTALANAAGIAAGIGPIIAPFVGAKVSEGITTGVNDLTQVAQIVTMVEAVNQTPGSGAEKLKAATPLVLQILKTSQAFSGKKVADEALAEKGAADVVTGIVEFMNSIHGDEVKTV